MYKSRKYEKHDVLRRFAVEVGKIKIITIPNQIGGNHALETTILLNKYIVSTLNKISKPEYFGL